MLSAALKHSTACKLENIKYLKETKEREIFGDFSVLKLQGKFAGKIKKWLTFARVDNAEHESEMTLQKHIFCFVKHETKIKVSSDWQTELLFK